MALAHICAGADETLVVQDGDAALSAGALAVPFVDQAGARAAPNLEGEAGAGGSGETPTGCARTRGRQDAGPAARPTFEQAILPFRHWQVLQSSSHLAPSGITLPMVMQGLPETERRRHTGERTFLSCGCTAQALAALPVRKRSHPCPLSSDDTSLQGRRV